MESSDDEESSGDEEGDGDGGDGGGGDPTLDVRDFMVPRKRQSLVAPTEQRVQIGVASQHQQTQIVSLQVQVQTL